MKKGLLLTLVAVSCCLAHLYAQGSDEESIRKLVASQHQAGENRDTAAFFASANPSPAFSVTYIGSNYYMYYNFKDFHNAIATAWSKPLTRKPNTYTYAKVNILEKAADHAVAQFISTAKDSTNKELWQSLETWTLSKHNDAWKIDRVLSVDTASYNPNRPLSDAVLEQEINLAGYRLLAAKKNEQAIRIFKMNVEMFPKSYNAYDSLGEAYMINGNKKEAIDNYSISVKLNPNNTNGKAYLEKLKSGK